MACGGVFVMEGGVRDGAYGGVFAREGKGWCIRWGVCEGLNMIGHMVEVFAREWKGIWHMVGVFERH